jgi:hypothetical protein
LIVEGLVLVSRVTDGRSVARVAEELGVSRQRAHPPLRTRRTLQTEWAYREVFLDNHIRSAAHAARLDHYNSERTRWTPTHQPRSVTNLMTEYI